ncbi:hypothetical protein SAMN05444358_101788 [Ruegeria halocynthiae]|uniref:Colicin import membrane protein n=1 Tax=Ruegeria halocynthiae TaxID=985054 RepID=A0A1H2TFG0_9RHOB|nr:hypothetical protein [Ruegeria halocynthiae]SDW42686.1 hypothetical protein SAMN05444358_101788 [Ruegeria halocynthiae]
MSRLLLIVAIAVVGAGAYYFATKPDPTPAEQLQSAAEEASEAVGEAASAVQEAASDAVDAATEQASEAASSVADQATEAASSVSEQASDAAASLTEQATDAASEAGDQVAALAGQGQELFNSWVQDGTLTAQNFDYDAMVASVQDSTLTQEIKTQALKIIDDIKASPELIVEKIQDLRNLLTQQ